MDVNEKRKMERFSLSLPALLSIKDDTGNTRAFEFMIRDISAAGVFFKTDTPLSVGTEVKMDLLLPLDKFKTGKNYRSHIDVSGSVIRKESQGMAVCFDKKYSISPWNR